MVSTETGHNKPALAGIIANLASLQLDFALCIIAAWSPFYN
jgi:hypothetical protein